MSVLNRLLMILLGLGVLVLGGLLIAETVADIAGQPLLIDRDRIGSTMRGLDWQDTELLPVWVAMIAIGLLLLLLSLIRGQPSVLPLPVTGEGRYADVNRRSVASILTEVAQDDEGVRSASATVTPRAAAIEVVARPGADTRAVKQRVEEAVADRLDHLQLSGTVKPRVSVTRSRERS